ncbi:hypothetical protein BI308_25815 [Roseofilum reptotaenium AO1-A]|uniref:Uncharacterized protein n=1 Tax=Roseofilum reptotaenium AO1-A TaxID=1925591 RepID=A0A1L9QC80_9CYAN|nr:hypothetical protein BI308_25815 [Roseofilum reptotaenium AO1-A]
MDTYIKQAWSLVNEYFYSNSIDISKQVDHELVRVHLKACQKSTPKGVRITQVRGRLFLRFKTATKSGNSDNSCNEDFTRDGCINALAKALAIFDKLKEIESESEFWKWYESEIKGTVSLENDIITIGDAIEIVKNNYLNGYDKCGRDRSDKRLRTNTLANYHLTYGKHFEKLNPKLRLTGENIISELNRNWGQLIVSTSGSQTLCSKGFRNAYTGVLKLLRDTRLDGELTKVTKHFGVTRIVRKTEEQTIDLETFLDFKSRVLGLNGYKLTTTQYRHLESRKSWMKAICFNLIYGFRCSEFKAIRNLDEPVQLGKRLVKALHDPTNDENIIVIGDGFWVTDTSGKQHYITVKTADRICRPMIHPDYPNLVELLGIKDPKVKFPNKVPSPDTKPDNLKGLYSDAMRGQLSRYISQVGGQGFTQTHALRHLANYHGKLAGLTRDQRALSLGHSGDMNDRYDEHLTADAEIDLLMTPISKEAEITELKQKLQQAKETILFLKKENARLTQAQETIKSLEETILFLKKENARLNELLGGNDNLPRIGS